MDQIEKNAGEAGLSESSHKRIAKARRAMPAMVATLALFWRWLRERLLCLSLSPEQELAFLEQFLPAAYLSVAAPKASTAARRLEIQAVAEQLKKHARDGTTAAERFFAAAPSDLFEWLLAHVVLPARPASSRLAT